MQALEIRWIVHNLEAVFWLKVAHGFLNEFWQLRRY